MTPLRVQDLAEIAGVTEGTVLNWRATLSDMPPPRSTHPSLWESDEVLPWLREHLSLPHVARRVAARRNLPRVGRADKDEILLAQGGRCAICLDPIEESRLATADHRHSGCDHLAHKQCPRCRRGVLCLGCNSGLGFFQDDSGRMRRAADYVDEWDKRHDGHAE